MNDKIDKFSFRLFLVDLFIYNIAFFVVNYLKRGTLVLSPMYMRAWFELFVIWIIVGLLIKKYYLYSYKSYTSVIVLFLKSALFTAYGVSFVVVILGLSEYSRIQIYGTFVVLFSLKIVMLSIYYFKNSKKLITKIAKTEAKPKEKISLSGFLILSDFIFLTLSFFAINWYKRGSFVLPAEYDEILLVIFGVWFVASYITKKFDKRYLGDYAYAVASCAKAVVLMTVIMSVLFFAFRLFYYSRGHIFGSFLLLLVLEALLYYLYFAFYTEKESQKDIESADELKAFLKQHRLDVDVDDEEANRLPLNPVREKLDNVLDFLNPWLFGFIDSSITLLKIDRKNAAILSTDTLINIETIDDNLLLLFINLHKTNNIRFINRYFLEIYKKLRNGGYFIGNVETIALHQKYIFEKYPKYIAEIIYFVNFLFRRVFPILRGVNKAYFAITKGRNRTISRAEVLGRLYFCGFKIIAEQENKGSLYFIARKTKTPSLDQSPSYGPLIRLKRSGLNGKMITIHKFRTMYPYSEYLQKYVYKYNKLKKGGKFRDDFRVVSSVGMFLRKTWLDELPMFYNWIKGDVKIFGVRPLSMQYLSLYNKELQEMRKKVKPGLIPPFYADLPKTFDEICESEQNYLQAYLKHPLRTQWVYFWRSLYNIVIKGARSQ